MSCSCSGQTHRANAGSPKFITSSSEKFSGRQTPPTCTVNEWVSPESQFIEPELWDQNVTSMLRQDTTGSLFIGIDASVKHDSPVLVAVKYNERFGDRLVLATHKIWVPSPGRNPMDFEA